ncbi:oligomeric, coiled-coil, peripheral membrane protein [Serendipita sp. 396]|nr:oligomeric, coiled-coil, peripheral membrane protein [Serendipita sp. 396]
MAFAYGASVIEVVRRKEFERFFLQRAQAMAEIMAKFSSSEKKRRQVYRGESLSLLPFATQGMDLQAPSVEISTFGTEEGPYEMTREDIEALLETMRQIEREHEALAVNKSSSYSQEVSYHPIRSTREALEKLLARMDGLEAEFDKIAEKSSEFKVWRPCSSFTDDIQFFPLQGSPITRGDVCHLFCAFLYLTISTALNEATAYNEATEQLHELQEQKATLEQKFSVERASLQNRIRELEVQNKNFNQQLPNLENTIDHLEVLLKQARNNLEQTHTRYEEARSKNETYEQDLSQRNSEISKLLDKLVEDEHAQQALKMERAAMADMTVAHNEQIERASRTATLHLERIAALERDAASLAEENRLLQQRDEENRRNIEDVERQLSHARDAEREAKVTLMDTVRERDRLLRDHQVEADGDRAVLEHRFSETRAQLDTARQQVQSLQQKLASVQPQLSSFQSQNSILHADLSSMREQLQRTSRELATSSLSENSAHQKENTLRAELSFANNALMQMEGKFERTERLLAQVFDVAIAFRNSHAKAMAQAQMMLRPIVPKNSLGISITGVNMADSTSTLLPIVGGTLEIGSPPRTPGLSGFHSGLPSANDRPPSPTPVDPSDPAAALDILREFDLDSFSETIAKTGVTIRKWQKQCREYRDRARSKITFRNFQKGDLALFLPTRNPSARPWAAFNMSFPHYFLNTTGHVSEQLKTREWIVARITSITERVVDSKDPSSNPYGLGNGVKYYLLDVEDWTANTPGSVLRPKASRNTSIPTRTGVGSVESWRDSTVLSQSPPQLGSLLSIQPKSNTDPDIAEGITAITSRPRATTGSSIGAGPSSLSRLLAQASKDASPVESKLAPETSSQKSPVDSPATPRALKPEPETKSVSGSPQLEPVTTQSTVEQPDPTTTAVPVPPNSIPSAHSAMPVHPPLSQRNSPKPSPRPRPVSLLVTGASPLASTSNVNAKASNIAASNSGVNRRHSSVRSSISSTRPTSIVRRPPFALSSSPSKAVVTASAVTAPIVSPSTDISSPFKTSSEDLNLSASITEDASETPSPADSVTEGMSSILSGHARRRTTSTITPATAALSHSAARGHQPSSPSPLSVTSLFSSLTGGWRKRRPDGASTATGHERSLSMSHPSPRDQRVAGSEGGAADILRRLDGRE